MAINKFDRKGAADALRGIRQAGAAQPRSLLEAAPTRCPVFGDEPLQRRQRHRSLPGDAAPVGRSASPSPGVRYRWRQRTALQRTRWRSFPGARMRYLAVTPRRRRAPLQEGGAGPVRLAREIQPSCAKAAACSPRRTRTRPMPSAPSPAWPRSVKHASIEARRLLESWPELQRAYAGDEYVVSVRDQGSAPRSCTPHFRATRSEGGAAGLRRPRRDPEVAAARQRARAHSVHRRHLPLQARAKIRPACSPARATPSRPTPLQAAVGGHAGQAPVDGLRLGHTALRQRPGGDRPDIYGKVGNSGVSIATLDDMKVLYDGFDLTSPSTSVGMTINGPAPTILAMFMNGDRPEARQVPRRARPRADARRGEPGCRLGQAERARYGAGRHPQGRPGPEHLHLLDRVLAQGDGRHRRILLRHG